MVVAKAVGVGAGMNEKIKHSFILGGIIIGGLIVIGGGAVATYTHYKQRGIRNNNPGNIRPGSNWEGISGTDSAKPNGPFLIFKGPEYGIRAMYKVLMTYRNTHKLSTIAGIINRWAPTNENDTETYVQAIAKKIGKGPAVPLALSDYPELMKAIIQHENGVQPYPDALIQQGIALAA